MIVDPTMNARLLGAQNNWVSTSMPYAPLNSRKHHTLYPVGVHAFNSRDDDGYYYDVDDDDDDDDWYEGGDEADGYIETRGRRNYSIHRGELRRNQRYRSNKRDPPGRHSSSGKQDSSGRPGSPSKQGSSGGPGSSSKQGSSGEPGSSIRQDLFGGPSSSSRGLLLREDGSLKRNTSSGGRGLVDPPSNQHGQKSNDKRQEHQCVIF